MTGLSCVWRPATSSRRQCRSIGGMDSPKFLASSRTSPARRRCACTASWRLIEADWLEVDPHDDAPERGPADLGEPSGDEDAAAADIQLAPGDLLSRMGDHRVALDGAGAALACEVDCSRGERLTHAASTEAQAGDEAGYCPDAVVGLVFSS